MHALKIRTTQAPRTWTPWGSIPAAKTPSGSEKPTRDPRRQWIEKAAKRRKP